MDLTAKKPNTVNPAFTLSARQEQLLFAALNSNTKQPDKSSPVQNNQNAGIFSMAPAAFTDSPVQAPGSGTVNGLDDSPFIDYDPEFEFDGDGSFDYGFDNGSQGQMIGKLPGTSSDGDAEADSHDKRSHPDDEEDDEEGGGKRREGDEKSSKKPGRKPLTSEPTSVCTSRCSVARNRTNTTIYRSARLRIVLLREHSGNARKSTSRI
jgi:AP-1-like factor